MNQIETDAQLEQAAKTVLTDFLTTVKGYKYTDSPSAGNYKVLEDLTVDGTTVIADMSNDSSAIETISKKSGMQTKANEAEKGLIPYSTDVYVMNTLARYLGALKYQPEGTVSTIVYNSREYTWKADDQGKLLKGSNWRDSSGKSLVSEIVIGENTSVKNPKFKLIDAKGYSIEVTFKAIVPSEQSK